MGSTVRRHADRRPSAHVTRVGQYLAAHYPSHTPAGWDQLVRGQDSTPRRFVAILEAAVALGDHSLVARLMAPVDATISRAPIPPFGADVVLMAQDADLSEDRAEAQYHAAPTADHLRTWLRAIDAQGAAHRVLRQAIANHLEGL